MSHPDFETLAAEMAPALAFDAHPAAAPALAQRLAAAIVHTRQPDRRRAATRDLVVAWILASAEADRVGLAWTPALDALTALRHPELYPTLDRLGTLVAQHAPSTPGMPASPLPNPGDRLARLAPALRAGDPAARSQLHGARSPWALDRLAASAPLTDEVVAAVLAAPLPRLLEEPPTALAPRAADFPRPQVRLAARPDVTRAQRLALRDWGIAALAPLGIERVGRRPSDWAHADEATADGAVRALTLTMVADPALVPSTALRLRTLLGLDRAESALAPLALVDRALRLLAATRTPLTRADAARLIPLSDRLSDESWIYLAGCPALAVEQRRPLLRQGWFTDHERHSDPSYLARLGALLETPDLLAHPGARRTLLRRADGDLWLRERLLHSPDLPGQSWRALWRGSFAPSSDIEPARAAMNAAASATMEQLRALTPADLAPALAHPDRDIRLAAARLAGRLTQVRERAPAHR